MEPFFTGSHRAWAEGYRRHSRHEIVLISLPGGPWRWRVQASGPVLGAEVVAAGRRRPVDAVVVSSMTDIAQLTGVARRVIGAAPVIAYRHESQILYPQVPGEKLPVGVALNEWAGLVAADRVVFNSGYHQRALLAALPDLLDRGDNDGSERLIAGLAARSTVVPVGVDLSAISPTRRPTGDSGPPTVLFNHRWHHDKQPEVALDALVELADTGIPFRLVFCGEDDLPDPSPITRRLRRLGDRVLSAGHLDRDAYLDALHRADIVVSTARQEFFGVAAVEAIAAGCVPLLPAELAYPDVIPSRFHDATLYERADLTDRLGEVLVDLDAARVAIAGLAEAARAYDWSVVAPELDALIETDVLRHR